MFNILFALFSFVSVLSFHSLKAAEEEEVVEQYDNLPIQQIDVIVANQEETPTSEQNKVLSTLKTKKQQLFSQNDFDNDLKTLSLQYDRVEPNVEVVEGRIFITLKVWPKPIIRTIRWVGNEKIPTSKLQGELGVNICTLFDRLSFSQAFHKLKAFYVKKGFFEAQLDYELLADECSNEVDIVINIKEGRHGKILDIVFFGFDSCEEDAILDLMITKKFNIFTSLFTNEGVYHDDAVQQDQFIILNYLQNQGYADAKIDIEVCETNKCNQIVLVIKAEKGERYCFGDLSFEGNHLLSDECIKQNFSICKEQYFSPEKIRETVANITNAYGKIGYIDAVVDYEPRLLEGENIYDVHFTIEEGEQYRVGMIKVFGNISTKTKVILHECLLIPGEIFNTLKLQATEARLMNIGYFKHVNVYAVKCQDQESACANYRDVHIEVEECPTGNFSAFIGYSTAESIFGGVSLTEQNFNYKGLSRLCKEGFRALRGGGEYLYLNATIGQKSSNYSLAWTKPYFNDTPWTVGFDLAKSSNRYISDHYDIHNISLVLRASYNINPFLRNAWHYRIKYSTVSTGHVSKQEKEAAHVNGLISAIGTGLHYDSTDSIRCPTKGLRSNLDAEYVGLGGDHHFCGFAYTNDYYFPWLKKGVFHIRGYLKFLIPLGRTTFNTIPLDERLFLGDDTQVRGFRPYKLGPKFPNGDPKGGLSMQYFSLEYAYRLFCRVELFTFFDMGALSKTQLHFSKMNMSLGYGARVQVLESIPRITLGMGYPLNVKHRSEIKRFFLSVDGRF